MSNEAGKNQDRSTVPTVPLQVLIVGAGVGGLCLAQGLKQSGIGVSVYERDPSPTSRGQGYRISLKQAGTAALRQCLPEHLFELCVATSIRPATRMVFTDHLLNPGKVIPLPHSPATPDPSGFGVNRLTLREVLLAGLEEVVHFGKTLVGYQQLGDGRVRARFADGTSATANLLVGADGTNSAVRGLLVPNAGIDDLHHMIYGKTPITADTLDWVPQVLVDTFNHVHGPDGIAFGVATCRTWEPVADAAARLAPPARLTDMPGYLAWTLWPTGPPDGADGAALQQLARGVVRDWHPAVRRIVDAADPAATIHLTVQSARPVQPWDTGDVTLLGDAVHTMSPGRGEGANVALRDAALLRDALADVAAGGAPLAQATARYEAQMLRYGFQAVADSLTKPFLRPAGQANNSKQAPWQ